MNKKLNTFGIIALIAIGGAVLVTTVNRPGEEDMSMPEVPEHLVGREMAKNDAMDVNFNNAKKSAHYESNTPAHGAILAGPPVNVVIDFNFDLAAPSSISITKEGTEYGRGDTVIDNNKLSMRRQVASDALDGKYTVAYKACWPDKSCHDGTFEFVIDRTKTSGYENMQNKQEVTIRMSEIMFVPKNIVISTGTKVTWINDEGVEHYINTDSHPAHTYYPVQNSRSLAKGATYTATFDKSGAYPYHCSAHATTMIGNIIVI